MPEARQDAVNPPPYETTTSSSPGNPHTLYICQPHNIKGLTVTDEQDKQSYYIGRYNTTPGHPNVIVYGGFDSSGPRLGLVRFAWTLGQDFQVYFGGLRTPADSDWETVGFSYHSGREQWTFASGQGGGGSLMLKMKARKWGLRIGVRRDFLIVDRGPAGKEKVVATYDKNGELVFLDGVAAEGIEVRCLTVVVALLERGRRRQKQAGRQQGMVRLE